jgi:hypothetical protein
MKWTAITTEFHLFRHNGNMQNSILNYFAKQKGNLNFVMNHYETKSENNFV